MMFSAHRLHLVVFALNALAIGVPVALIARLALDGAIGPVGHDLHGRRLLARHLHANELVAQMAERRQDGVGNAGFEPLMPGQVFGGIAQATKKAAPCKATPRGTDGMSGRVMGLR